MKPASFFAPLPDMINPSMVQPADTGGYTMAAATVFAPEQDVAARVAQITSQDSPLMRQARTTGLQTANRRGVLNSSMGIGAAQAAVLGVATPIASQESQERTQSTLGRAQITSTDRNAMLDAQVRSAGDYNSTVSNIMANTKLSASARNAALSSARGVYQQTLDSLRQAYGVNTPATQAPAPAGVGAAGIAPTGGTY